MKYANDIVKEMDARGSIEVPKECFASEGFDIWMYGDGEEVEKNRIIWNSISISSEFSLDSSDNTNYGDAAE